MKPKLTVLYVVFSSIILIEVQADRPRVAKTKTIKNIPQTTPMYKVQEERRKLPLFPKNAMRFVVTPLPFESQNNESVLQTKKPLMEKFVPTEKSEDKIVRQPVTRRPLMKAIDFVIEPVKSKNNLEMKREIRYTEFVRDRTYSARYKPNDKELIDVDEFLYPPSFIEPNKENNRHKRLPSNNVQINDSIDTVEDIDDRKEFILTEGEEMKLEENDVPKDDPTYVPKSYETTTEFEDSKLRFKRKVNIIEEENQPTTIAQFKSNSRDLRLSYDLAFKNINA